MLIKLVENDDHATFTVLFTGEETLMVGCTHTISSVSSVSVPLLLSFRRYVGCCGPTPNGLETNRAHTLSSSQKPLASLQRESYLQVVAPHAARNPLPSTGAPSSHQHARARTHTPASSPVQSLPEFCAVKIGRLLLPKLCAHLAYTFAPPLPSRGTIFLPAH
jgi:hypothetical protein